MEDVRQPGQDSDGLISTSADIHESVDYPAVPLLDVLLSSLMLKGLMRHLFHWLRETES